MSVNVIQKVEKCVERTEHTPLPPAPLLGVCETCKHFGGQGCFGLAKEDTGDTRYCAVCVFGDFDKPIAPMPEWKVTWGNDRGFKGNIYVHKKFGCINHNPKFETPNEKADSCATGKAMP